MKDPDAPDWLPELMTFGGDWSTYVAAIYAKFRADFFNHRPHFRGRRVNVRTEPRDQGKEAGFWHATSEGETEDERTPDLRRCERVAWVRAVIEAAPTNVCIWETLRGSDRRVLIALPDFSYVVILADRKTYVLFITAFCVEREHRRNKLRKEFEAWKKAQKS